MKETNGSEATKPKPLSPLERTSLAEVYQAHIRLVSTMRKAHPDFISVEMKARNALYVVGVADAIGIEPLYNVEHCKLHFFSNPDNLKQFVRDMSERGKIYHCTDEHGQTLLLAA